MKSKRSKHEIDLEGGVARSCCNTLHGTQNPAKSHWAESSAGTSTPETDSVLTTLEVQQLLEQHNVRLADLPEEPLDTVAGGQQHQLAGSRGGSGTVAAAASCPALSVATATAPCFDLCAPTTGKTRCLYRTFSILRIERIRQEDITAS